MGRIGFAGSMAAVAGLMVACVTGASAAEWRKVYETSESAAQDLRGFGRVDVVRGAYESDAGKAWSTLFRCQSPLKASTLAGKFMADLRLSPGVEDARLKVGEAVVPALTVPGGATFAVCVDGAESRIVIGATSKTLSAYLADQKSLSSTALTAAEYPAYLDRYDRYGWGWYGLGGYANVHDWMGLAAKYDGKKEVKNPVEDFDFAAKYKFRFELWLDPAGFDTSDGIVKNTEAGWLMKKANEAGLPLSSRVYGEAGGADWSARRFPDLMEQPADFMMTGWHGFGTFWITQPHLSWNDLGVHHYMAVKTMDMIKPYAAEPLMTGWMHPHGELAHNEWYDIHDDYSTMARKNWQAYLRKQGVTLAELSRMYGRPGHAFNDWDEVTIPEFATFAGLGGQVVDLKGKWWSRLENGVGTKIDDAWLAKSPEDRYPGVKEKWWNGNIDGSAWSLLNMPGDKNIYKLNGDKNSAGMTFWFRRSFDMTPAQLNLQSAIENRQSKIYLYWFPISFDGIHLGKYMRYHEVYVNGQKAGEIGSWGALDVTKLLKSGANEIALHLQGALWDGRIFLSTQAPKVFPYLGKDMNQLWITWHEWHKNSKFEAWRIVLDGMRQVDPDRPIKFMAPIKFGEDRWLKLATQYGGFGHFTGEGMWYFPWYKRYSYLYDLPATSETAGPANNLADQFDSFRRTFLAGLNGHDAVFQANTYTRVPELRKFWEDHNTIIKQMGKYDLHGPQVLLYRSSKMTTGLVGWTPFPKLGETTREIQSPWNWDIGRGTLQTIGQSYCYLDDGGVADGKMYGYGVMVDCGNETMPVGTIDQIEAWVKAGGVFVTFPFTGRNSMLEPDTWPIRKLTGCEIAKIRPVGDGTVTIKKDQNVFKALAGKTFPDKGRSVDWLGGNHNLISVELKPGADSEVLATFENGAPAIVKRKLGKGAVIALGSAFWRDSQDRTGVWWPEPIETDFFADLLDGAGYPAAPCVADNRLVWPQPYRSNNGLDLIACLVSWNNEKDVDTTIRMRLPKKPASLVCYGVDGQKDLPFEWNPSASSGQDPSTGSTGSPQAGSGQGDGEAVAKVAMPAKEVKVVRATGCLEPSDAVAHWWGYQKRIWHELAKPVIDFTPYTKGRWIDPTLDLRYEAKLTDVAPAGDAWAKPGFDDKTWKTFDLGVFTIEGAPADKPLWIRKTFSVPKSWNAGGGKIYLVNGSWSGPHYVGEAKLSLNGSMLQDFPGGSYAEYDVTKLLTDKENVIAYEFKGKPVSGIVGNVYLYHATPPEKSIPLDGAWNGSDEKGVSAAIALPGKGTIKDPTRSFFIPEEWEGKYSIRFHIEGARGSVLGAWVNGRLVRRHHHGLGNICDIDITSELRFGQENTFVLANQDQTIADMMTKKAFNWDIQKISIDLYPAARAEK
ncbi:MAG: hypothetical protein WAX69_03720 [Victivallales bacterium]